jgi:hypothetical protein
MAILPLAAICDEHLVARDLLQRFHDTVSEGRRV